MSSGTGYRPQSYLPDGLARMLEQLRRDVEYLKRYRAPVVNLDEPVALTAPSNWPNVVSLGTQADPDSGSGAGAWGGWPTGWADGSAEWVWTASGERPANEAAWILGVMELSTDRDVEIDFTIDNMGTLYVDGAEVGTSPDFQTFETVALSLSAGTHRLAFAGQNAAESIAGVLVSVRDANTGTVIFRSTDQGGWYGWTSQPAGWPEPSLTGGYGSIVGTTAEVATSWRTIESAHVDGGSVIWRWGVDAYGRPYFDDTDGVDEGDEARLIVVDGSFYVEEITL